MYGDGDIVPTTVEGNSNPGGVDGECATGPVERAARSLLAATCGANILGSHKAPAHAGARGSRAALETRGVPRAASTARGPRNSRRLLTLDANARQRGLQQSRIPVVRLDHERDGHAA